MTIPDQDERLEAIRARAEAATPGPWIGDGEHGITTTAFEVVAGNYDYEEGGIIDERDTAFIAEARADVPYLLDLVVRERERVGVLTVELRDRLERLVGTVNAVNGADGDAFPDTRHEMLYGVADDIGAVIVELIRWAAVTEGEPQR